MIILGIDPGSTRVGYGVIEKNRGELVYVRSGLFKIPKKSESQKLLALEKELNGLIKKIKPDKAGLEKLFFVKNQKTAFEVAQSRGIILNTLSKKRIPIIELAPSEIKLAVTGDGRASKQAVAKMVRYFLNLPYNKMIDDITDALAIAITISAGTY